MKTDKIFLLSISIALSACGNTLDKLSEVGSGPQLAKIENPTKKPDYKPISIPTPVEPSQHKMSANSLWQPGARAFFKDQRATRVGDLLTVVVSIADKADLDNSTNNTRKNEETLAAPQVFGLHNRIFKQIPGNQDPASLLNLSGDKATSGSGTIGRKETITTKIAAMITQVLPNGNLVINGTQEVRVNTELRQIMVDGIIRPEDISSDNTIQSDQIAEARISYGGRGVISDVQQPRIGNQLIDILSPF